MKKLFSLFILTFTGILGLSAQIAPANVCTSPASYNFDQEVTWYFNLKGNSMVTPGENLYLWSWEPVELPNGRALLTYEQDMIWSLTFTPTELYGVTVEEIEAKGDAAFWSNILNEAGATVTGTIPYPLKEQLRLGNLCEEMTKTNKVFYVDFGPNDVTNGNVTPNPDSNGNYWNNPTNTSSSAAPLYLVDKDNKATEVNLKILSDMMKNGILNGGLLAPEDSLLDDLAVATATQDYFFQTTKGIIALDGLDPERGYVFTLFGSRNTESTRITEYNVRGGTQVVETLQTSGTDIGGSGYHGNNSNVVVTKPVLPDNYGRIKISVSVVEGGFAYLNMMKVQEVDPNPTVLIDFGPNDITNGNITQSPDTMGHYWNNINSSSNLNDSTPLVDVFNFSNNAYLKLTEPFLMNGILNGGLLEPSADSLGDFAVATATQDYFFTTSSASMDIGGLDTTSKYVFSFFGTRNTENQRITSYTLNGLTTFTDSLQTSGTDIGGAGFHGNNSTILVSDTIQPDSTGMINLQVDVVEGGFAYLNCLGIKEILGTVETEPLCAEKDSLLIAFMGSSVAYGQGATGSKGYAYEYGQLLTERYNNGEGADWSTTNISIGGNNTIAVMNRWEDDLLPLCSRYVIYGLSLGNEGIHNQGEPMFNQFRDNMLQLIAMARDEGIEPVVVNCYARGDFNAVDYAFTKEMNLLIHSWDVASVNSLGAVDDGAGRWVDGYWADTYHPNTTGHLEMSYAFVPSLFDALAMNKSQPQRATNTYMESGTSVSSDQIKIVPENTVHSFTYSIDFKTSGTGHVMSFLQEENYAKLRIDPETGILKYVSPEGVVTNCTSVVNDDSWHNVVITHYYARGITEVYVDSVIECSVEEKLVPEAFYLNDQSAPETIEFKDLFFYRAGMNSDEIAAIYSGEMLKSSLEIYAPLDGQQVVGDDPLVNLAQSTNTLVSEAAIFTSATEINLNSNGDFRIYPNPVSNRAEISYRLQDAQRIDISLFNVNGQKVATIFNGSQSAGAHQINWSRSKLGLNNGIYICKFRSDELNISEKIIVHE